MIYDQLGGLLWYQHHPLSDISVQKLNKSKKRHMEKEMSKNGTSLD